jgi:hypothetical protein
MRTTLTIDDDVLAAARAIADRQHRSIGEIVSELARRSLTREPPQAERNGLPILPVRDPKIAVTLDVVNALRDEVP